MTNLINLSLYIDTIVDRKSERESERERENQSRETIDESESSCSAFGPIDDWFSLSIDIVVSMRTEEEKKHNDGLPNNSTRLFSPSLSSIDRSICLRVQRSIRRRRKRKRNEREMKNNTDRQIDYIQIDEIPSRIKKNH